MDISTWKTSEGLPLTSSQSSQHYENLMDFNSTLKNNCQRLTLVTISNEMSSRLQQQSNPVRYFQIYKPSRAQYNLQTQTVSNYHHHQLQQSQYINPHYPQYYPLTVLPCSINLKKYKNIPPIYFVNQLDTKSTTLSQNFNFKQFDTRQFNNPSHGIHEVGPQPKYILANGHIVSPSEFSLTTCFTLTNCIDQLYPTTIHNNSNTKYLSIPSSSSSSSSPLSQSVYTHSNCYAFGFVNIIEAVPDLLKNLRPEAFIIRSTVISVSVGHEKFLRDQRNLIKNSQPLSNSDEFSIEINPQHWSLLLKRKQINSNKSEKLLEIQRHFSIHSDNHKINNQLNNSLNQKTYANILQDTTKYDCDKLKIMNNNQEINSMEVIDRDKIINNLNKDNKLNENEDKQLTRSTATFIARAARISCRVSSTDSGISVGESSASFLSLSDIEDNQIIDRDSEEDEKNNLNKMAEDFCLGTLANGLFLQIFDEYNKHRRRMSYTQLLIDRAKNEINIITDNLDIYTRIQSLDSTSNNCGINSTYFYHHYQHQLQQLLHDNIYIAHHNNPTKIL